MFESPEGRPVTLLLSATIRAKRDLPEATALLLDADRRLGHYLENLEYWRSEGGWKGPIVFAENSGHGLGEIEAALERLSGAMPWEVLDLSDLDFPGEFGKGYGEAQLLRHAFERSRLLAESRLAIKSTGLQIVANLRQIIDRIPGDTRWIADLRDHSLFETLGIPGSGRWCDTRLFAVEPAFFVQHLARLYEGHVREHYYLETAHYHAMKRHLGEPGVYPRLPLEPDYRGPAGHWGKDYGGFLQRTKRAVRGTIRRMFPGLWI